MKEVDPIKLLIEKASAGNNHVAISTAALVTDESPFEIPLVPPAGAKVKHMTVASTYRTPIPVLYDPVSRTCFPLPNNK